jgi:predicted nucleic acid-binding protein
VSGPVVVDASLALKWVLREPYSVEALGLLEEWRAASLRPMAPSLFAYEVANALFKRVRRAELALELASSRLSDLLSMGPRLVHDRSTYRRALGLAHRFGRPTSYDAHYLALAEREGCECWTADERLWNAVKQELPWVRWVGERPSPSAAR